MNEEKLRQIIREEIMSMLGSYINSGYSGTGTGVPDVYQVERKSSQYELKEDGTQMNITDQE